MEHQGKLFALDENLRKIWADFTENSDEKCFRKFVKGFVSSWESEISPTWGKTVTSCLNSGYQVELGELPDELLPALSKFLIISKDDADQGNIDSGLVRRAREIVKALTITCRQVDHIELAAGMNFVRTITQMATLLLSNLLELESMFFMRRSKKKAEEQTKTLREEIIGFILQSCHFLESIYDPYFCWRAFMCGKEVENANQHQVELHPETIPFLYESFETALVECFPDIGLEMLIVLGAVISGSKSNGVHAVSPATSKMLLKTIRDSDATSQELHICAIFCSAKSIQLLHCVPMFERQVDINNVIGQYHQILKSLNEKESCSMPTLVEGVSVLSKILHNVDSLIELKTILASNGTIQLLLDLIRDCKLDKNGRKMLLPVVIDTLSLLLCDCPLANEKMIKSQGYEHLFNEVNGLGPPDSTILKAILAMATHGSQNDMTKPELRRKRFLKNIQPILYLLKWLSETDYENANQQVWLCENLRSLCAANIQNKMVCCTSGLILSIVQTLKQAHQRLDGKSAIELLLLLKSLGMHSITPLELKHLIGLLKDEFPFKSHVIHVLSAMSKGDGFAVCRQYFDISAQVDGLNVPQIRNWQGPITGFTFHCWIRLDKMETFAKQRRQIYSFYTNSGNGFEAFVTSGGTLVVAAAHKKEFLAVPLEDGPLDDELWHCIDVCHSAAKRPFGSSLLQVYIDGAKRMECVLKYPSISEPITYCTIGSPVQRSSNPALNLNQVAKPTLKEGIMDAIKIGVPGVFNLPQMKSGSNDSHIRWTLIGLEDQLWGKSVSLSGQIGMVTCFQDGLAPHLIKLLHDMGPNSGLIFPSEENPDALDINNRLVFFYSSRACRGQSCPNLHPPHFYEAAVMGAQPHCTHDVKDVINCIGGGVHVLFPLLESAAFANLQDDKESLSYMSMREEDSFTTVQPSKSSKKKKSKSNPNESENQDWELLPSSSFSDWKLEQNPISGFLTLIKNFVSGHTINLEQLMRGGGVAIIGYLLSQAKPELIDVNVLMAAQLLIELAQGSEDQKLLHQIYQNVLFDFRIWSRSAFHVQIGHIQYLSTLVKSDRKFFRRKFGVQFLLDVIRAHYCESTNLSIEDSKTIRVAIFGLIKYFLQREVSAKEALPLINFMLTLKNNQTVFGEVSDMLIHYLESKNAKDQMFLVLYEAKKADLLYCLLTEKNGGIGTRIAVLRLLMTLLRTNRIANRHKMQRMHLQEAKYLGLMHLRLKRIEDPLMESEAALLFDVMSVFDDSATYQGLLGLAHHLRASDLELKLSITRRIMRVLFAKSDAPSQFSKQIGWQECLASLLVKKRLRPELESSVSIDDVVSLDDSVSIDNVSLSPSHYIEKATNVAMTYLPSSVEATVAKASQKVADAQNKVYRTRERASSFLGAIRQRSNTLTSREDIPSQPRHSPQPPYDPFSGVFDDRLSIDTRSTSTSSEDLRSETTAKPESSSLTELPSSEEHELEDEVNYTDEAATDKEEELCSLLINILFTVMWRGGAPPKERGCVIASINMLALDNNNELYKSHVELKRRIVELCIQAVLADMKDSNCNSNEVISSAEDVMQWAYDLIVLDPYGNFKKKITESLLDGILALTEILMVFSEGKEDLEWCEMAKMAFDILLTCAEKAKDIEICTMATAKLHALVQTRASSSTQENAFLLFKLNKIIETSLKENEEEHYSFCVPIMKALLEKCKTSFNLQVQIPSLNLRQSGPEFFEFFKTYSASEEWNYFLTKKVEPLSEGYWRGYLANLPTEMDVFWAECYEMTKVLAHKRSREIGESKLKFQAKYQEPYEALSKAENMRFSNFLGQQQSYSSFIRKRWQMSKRQFFGPRGAWSEEVSTVWSEHWNLASNENFERMRMKLIPNPTFDPHLEASAQRDNVKMDPKSDTIFKLQLSKDAVQNLAEDSLTEDDLKSIAMEQMETAQETNESEKLTERLILSEDCQRVTYMSVVKGKLELTTSFLYFFDGSPYREDVERHDFRWSLSQIRELHLRRYNLRRTALEIFLVDQTNMFINFPSNRKRNKVYSKVLSLRPLNLIYSSSRSPADLLKSSGLIQKWVHREISNFEYLMQLNTIAGRTFNDLSQYPIFPWVISDYSSSKLNLDNPKTFRDLSKPIGIQNPKHIEEVRNKYENFEDPSGTVAKFHYGTHYSNSAMVLHYLVRVEPFTSLHIDLQSGRFDVADRQFHSIPQTWKSLFDNVNDVKELIPEFYFFPEFLLNLNNFDLGKLQGGKKARVGDVILPKWASNADDFVRKHRQALESDYVSDHLHHWIDLIFGYKQKGEEAAEAFNVFYYCTYEGAVNLDAIQDPEEREAVEGMINNFGQTPCQLLKEAHPKRLTLEDSISKKKSRKAPSLMATMPDWKPYLLDLVASTDKDPVVYINAPGWRRHFSQTSADSTIITINSSGIVGIHQWRLLQNDAKSGDFAFDVDPTFLSAAGSTNTNSLQTKLLPSTFAPGLLLSANLFVATPDGKHIVSGGHWDNSLRVFNIHKGRYVASVIRHIDIVTCVSVCGHLVMSGSLDTTSIIWDVSASITTLRPLQVLAGHDKSVKCVALSAELDMAASGSEDGTVNVYSIKEGQFLRTLKPPTTELDFVVSKLTLSSQGHVVIGGHSKDVHSIHVYTINGRLLQSKVVLHRTTCLLVLDHEHILHGDENGELSIRDLYDGEIIHHLNLQMPIQGACLTARNSHLLVPLRDGKLIVVGSKMIK